MNAPFALLDGETLTLDSRPGPGCAATWPCAAASTWPRCWASAPPTPCPASARPRWPPAPCCPWAPSTASHVVGNPEPSTLPVPDGRRRLHRCASAPAPARTGSAPARPAALTGQTWTRLGRVQPVGVRLALAPRTRQPAGAHPHRRTGQRGRGRRRPAGPAVRACRCSSWPTTRSPAATRSSPASSPRTCPPPPSCRPGAASALNSSTPLTLIPLRPAPTAPHPEGRTRMKKVLIANRGEIAVRIARACADASHGLRGRVLGPRRRCAARAPRRRGLRPERRRRRRNLPGHRQDPGRSPPAPAPTPCTRATASCPRTPTSPRRSSTPG